MTTPDVTKEKNDPPASTVQRVAVALGVCIIILGGSAAIANYFMANQEEAQRRTPPRVPPLVTALRVQTEQFTIHLPSQGRVQARAVTTISPEVAGRVQSLEPVFKEGGFFTPGQKLLTLDNTDHLNTVAKAEGAIAQLKAKLALEKIDRAGLTNAVSVAAATLEQAQVALELEKIEAASFQNAFNVAKANLEQAKVALRLEQLERSTYSNAVTVAQAKLKQAEANLQLTLAEQSAAIANLKRLDKLAGASPLARKEPQVAEARAAMDAEQAALTKAQKDVLEKPRQKEADLQAKIDVAQVKYTEAQENLKLPAQREADLRAKIKVAQAQLTEAKENLKRPAQLEADLQAQIRIAESEAAQAKRNAERTVVRAPEYHGRITEKRVDIGQVVSAGSVLATAIATDYAEVRLPLSNRRLAYLSIPEPLISTNNTEALQQQTATERPRVTLTAEIGDEIQQWQGVIDRAEGRYDSASQQLFLIAQVSNPYRTQPALRAGLFVRADITGNSLNNVVVLRRHVVRRGDEVALALPGKNNTWTLQRRKINVLWRDEAVMVTDSLKPGEVVIQSPVDYAANGEPLRVAIEGEAPPPPVHPAGNGKGGKKKKTKATSG